MKPIGSCSPNPGSTPSPIDLTDNRRLAVKPVVGRHPEILFWLLLLGSWQFLSAGGNRNGAIGLCGAILFCIFASRHLGKLTAMGFHHTAWLTPPPGAWREATTSGMTIALAIYCVGVWSGSDMRLMADWKLMVLQVSLGPVVEEIIFRGYVFALLAFAFRRIASPKITSTVMIAGAAVLFAVVHLAQPGGSWLRFWCISATGTLYGIIRMRTSSTAAAAAAHAAYNLTLHAMNWLSGILV